MSIALMSKIMQGGVPYKTTTHKLTIICIADNANDGGVAYPSIGRIMHKVGITDRRHMKRVLRDLEAEGKLRTALQAAHSPEGKPLETNVYYILPPAYEGGEPYVSKGGVHRPLGEGSTDPPRRGPQTPLITNEPSGESKTVQSSLFGQPNHEEGVSQRQKFAIDASIQESARKKMKDLLGTAYPFAQTLVNKHGYKAETLHQRLSSNPSLLVAFKELDQEGFDIVLLQAKQQAGQHTEGWKAMIGPQFLAVLESQTRKPTATQVFRLSSVVGRTYTLNEVASQIMPSLLRNVDFMPTREGLDMIDLRKGDDLWHDEWRASRERAKIWECVGIIMKADPKNPVLDALDKFRELRPDHPVFKEIPDDVKERYAATPQT